MRRCVAGAPFLQQLRFLVLLSLAVTSHSHCTPVLFSLSARSNVSFIHIAFEPNLHIQQQPRPPWGLSTLLACGCACTRAHRFQLPSCNAAASRALAAVSPQHVTTPWEGCCW